MMGDCDLDCEVSLVPREQRRSVDLSRSLGGQCDPQQQFVEGEYWVGLVSAVHSDECLTTR